MENWPLVRRMSHHLALGGKLGLVEKNWSLLEHVAMEELVSGGCRRKGKLEFLISFFGSHFTGWSTCMYSHTENKFGLIDRWLGMWIMAIHH